MGGKALGKYVIPGLQTAIGLGSEFVAPGNPIGISMATGGIGQLAGGAAGGNTGQALGGGIGGLLGGLGGGLMGGLAGLLSKFGIGGGAASSAGMNNLPMVGIGTAGAPSADALKSALGSNPALAGINPNMITGASAPMPAPAPASASGNSLTSLATPFMSMAGQLGQGFLSRPQTPPMTPASINMATGAGTSSAPNMTAAAPASMGASNPMAAYLAYLQGLKG